ncbi:hypothetical protein [Oryza sativa Japonica Group]|uniref:Uncharacterized protein n=1 Tax=Oryza sativa subsp. japonica TaxID=39947 RepID=Q5VP17_ORYSJ|nr:hypothetical protein [Oryza sativa Japonica Group]
MENASVVNADVEWRDEYGIDTEDWMSLSMRATQRKWRVCIESIPRYKYLKLKYETADGVRIKLFMLELEACLYAEPQMGLGNEGEDHELYEDPDVVREAFERQARLQHIAIWWPLMTKKHQVDEKDVWWKIVDILALLTVLDIGMLLLLSTAGKI